MINFGLGSLGMAPITLPEITNPAFSENILENKEAINGAEQLIVGTMPNNGAEEIDIELVDDPIAIAEGYHNGEGFVQIAAAEQAKIIGANILTGVTILGVEGTAIELDGEEILVTPAIEEQILVPTEGNGFTEVTIEAVTNEIDEYIVAANIKDGITILGVEGTVVELDGEELEVTPTIEQQVLVPTEGNGFTEVTVAAVTGAIDANIAAANILTGVTILGVDGTAIELDGEELEVTPTIEEQILVPTEGNGFTEVTVAAVTGAIDANIAAANIKDGVTILGVEGTLIELDGKELEVTPTTQEQELTPEEGNAFTVVTVAAVTSAIDEFILSENIKAGVTILGVLGTYTGS